MWFYRCCCCWAFRFSLMLWLFIQVVAYSLHSFYCWVVSSCTISSNLFIFYQLMDIWIVSSFWILWNKVAVNTYRSLCRNMSSILLVEFLGHMISVCLSLYMKLPQIFKVVVSFYISISNVWTYSISVIIMDMFMRDFEVIFPYVFVWSWYKAMLASKMTWEENPPLLFSGRVYFFLR